jgi:hypothetical protein
LLLVLVLVVVVVVVVVLVVLVVVVFVVVVALGLLLRDLAVPDRSSTQMRNMVPTLGTTPQAEFFTNHLPRTWSGRSRSMTCKPLQHLEMAYPKLEPRLPLAQIREFNGPEVQVFFCLFRHTRTLKRTSPQCCGHIFAAANRLVAFFVVLGESCPEKEGNERHSMAGSIWIYVLQLIHHPANALNLRTETRESGSIIEGRLEVKLQTIRTDEKHSREQAERR